MTSKARIVVGAPVVEGGLVPLSEVADVYVLPEHASRAELLAALPEAVGLISMLTQQIDEDLLSVAPQLRVVANHAVGVNNIDLAATRRRGIIVTNTPDVLTEATADLSMALILSVTRRMSQGETILRRGEFTGWTPTYLLGVGLRGKTLGLIGYGRIAQALEVRARAFGLTTISVNSQSTVKQRQHLLSQSDIVSLHVPLSEQTFHLIDAAALAQMKRGAYLINTSRGPVVDEAALAAALHAGHLAGAGIDVYENEPCINAQLMTAPNTTLLPHLGSNTVETRLAMASLAARNVAAVLRGKAAITPI